MANPDFTISDVLAWARTKPADERYDYSDGSNCALCQFLDETGRAANPRVDMWQLSSAGQWYDADAPDAGAQYPAIMEPALNGGCGFSKAGEPLDDAWTFGGLVERLEKLIWLSPETYLVDEVAL